MEDREGRQKGTKADRRKAEWKKGKQAGRMEGRDGRQAEWKEGKAGRIADRQTDRLAGRQKTR